MRKSSKALGSGKGMGNEGHPSIIEGLLSHEGEMILFYRVFKIEPGPDKISYQKHCCSRNISTQAVLEAVSYSLLKVLIWGIPEMNKIFY